MRAEKERQERIKRKALSAFGKPPPNFRLMMAEGEARGGRPRSNTQSKPADSAPAAAEQPQKRLVRSQSLSGLHWKEALRLKKQQEVRLMHRCAGLVLATSKESTCRLSPHLIHTTG